MTIVTPPKKSIAEHISERSPKIVAFLRLLFVPEEVFEVRCLDVGDYHQTYAGFFNDFEKAAQAIVRIDLTQSPRGIYVCMNHVQKELLNRINNRLTKAKRGEMASDKHVTRRRWFFIDIDPEREGGISGIPASQEEKDAAEVRAEEVSDWLMQEFGFHEPVRMDSGNGRYLLYPIDLPNDDASTALIKRALASISAKWSDNRVKIDVSVCNAARIIRCFLTGNRKGDSTTDRPHRFCLGLTGPDYLKHGWADPVPRAKLEAVAALTTEEKRQPARTSNGSSNCSIPHGDQQNGFNHRLKVSEWLSSRSIEFQPSHTLADGRECWPVACVFDANHGHDASFIQSPDGKMAFKCFHDGCSANGWQEAKERVGKPDGDHYDPPYRQDAKPSSSSKPAGKSPRRFEPETLVKCGDRGNIGTVVSDDGGQTVRIHFVSPEGNEATVEIPRTEVASASEANTEQQAFKLKPISSREFAFADYRLEYLIKRVWVKDQPCMLGGPHKALKTGTMLEIAISGGTGTPLFGKPEFAVPKAFNVMVLSGESGMATLQETARRIAFAHQIKLEDAQIWWEDTLPKIAKPDHLLALGEAITKVSAKLCLIDPAYLCLLSGDTQGRQASNLFDVGALLTGLADIGRQTGCGIGLAHHMKKNPAEPFAIPKLEDLAYAGFAEFARQWLLINRRSEYRDDGRHELWLSIGGSAGHSSTWAYTVEEGIPDDNFKGRFWDVTIEPASEVIEGKKRDRERQRENDRSAKQSNNVDRIMTWLQKQREPETRIFIRDALGMNDRDFKPAWAEILSRKAVIESIKKGANNRSYEAFKVATGQPDTTGFLPDCPAVPLHNHSSRTGAL